MGSESRNKVGVQVLTTRDPDTTKVFLNKQTIVLARGDWDGTKAMLRDHFNDCTTSSNMLAVSAQSTQSFHQTAGTLQSHLCSNHHRVARHSP
ncbi:hypothetical protein ACFX13_004145 [Malus domestica]